MKNMTAPTVDTPLTTDIERVDAFIDKGCTGQTPTCPCPHDSWDRITAALLAARREVEALAAAVQGAIDVWSQHAEDSEEWSEIKALCSALADRAALAATPEEKNDCLR